MTTNTILVIAVTGKTEKRVADQLIARGITVQRGSLTAERRAAPYEATPPSCERRGGHVVKTSTSLVAHANRSRRRVGVVDQRG
jgi:hypothetical protein